MGKMYTILADSLTGNGGNTFKKGQNVAEERLLHVAEHLAANDIAEYVEPVVKADPPKEADNKPKKKAATE